MQNEVFERTISSRLVLAYLFDCFEGRVFGLALTQRFPLLLEKPVFRRVAERRILWLLCSILVEFQSPDCEVNWLYYKIRIAR